MQVGAIRSDDANVSIFPPVTDWVHAPSFRSYQFSSVLSCVC